MSTRKKGILLLVVILLCIIGYFSLSNKNTIMEIMSLDISRSEEYVMNPRTLAEWRDVNPNVVMVLEFTSNGILHNIPVLEVENGDKYMKRNLWGEYDTMGSVFIEKDVSPIATSNNWIVYGHASYTKDWNFTFLKKYTDQGYLDKHSTFQVEQEDGFHTYRILSFAEYDYELGEENLYFGWFNGNFTDKEALDMFKKTEPYILTMIPGIDYRGQQIMTIVTCNMKKKDSRFVLMAIETN